MQHTPSSNSSNVPEWTVTGLSAAIRGTIEDSFGRVRVRGEVGRVSRPASGHVYLDLKDDRSVLAAVIWRSQASRLQAKPREGLEVVATGRITTYGRQSKYQMVIEQLRPAGEGAILAAIEALRRHLQAEGLFRPERKKPLPILPETIGVVTSPSGSVIRDILHRIQGRYPTRVIVWPAAVQGTACPGEVANAINGFNTLPEGSRIPRPSLIIVARGGGSVEDLAGFSDELVVRAVANSDIPVISAVGHETDTALCDHAADVRAPTPSAAAELAVPESAQLRTQVHALDGRRDLAAGRQLEKLKLRLGARAASLPRTDSMLSQSVQRLDNAATALSAGSKRRMQTDNDRLHFAGVRMQPTLLLRREAQAVTTLNRCGKRLRSALNRWGSASQHRIRATAARLSTRLLLQETETAGRRLQQTSNSFDRLVENGISIHSAQAFGRAAERLHPTLLERETNRAEDRLHSRARLLESLSYRNTLSRGFAVVRNLETGGLISGPDGVGTGTPLEIEFREGKKLPAKACPSEHMKVN